MHRSLTLFALLALAACFDPQGGQPETEGSADCDNLDETHCTFPFPSDRFLATRDDGTKVVSFGENGLPENKDYVPMNPAAFEEKDGFSPITPIFFALEKATLEGAPRWDAIERSVEATSLTQVIEADTGRRIGHFVEWDYFAEDAGRQIAAIRLAEKLAYGKRYVVAVAGLKDAEGNVVPATRGFAALRDRKPSVVRGVDARRERFEKEVFAVLEKAGVERGTLQLAWDFTTATEANCNALLLDMRTKLFEAIGADGPEYRIDKVDELADDDIARIVHGTAMFPSFLEGDEADGDVRRIRRDASGAPVIQGVERWPFEVQIPKSVLAGTAPAPILMYGHGLLGSRSEARTRWLRQLANREGFVIVATDMQGMSEPDALVWTGVLGGDVAQVPYLAEKPHQGVLNHLALTRMMTGRFTRETHPLATREGAPFYDPKTFWYYGNSQGGTMGGVIMPLQTEITRGILGVPGGAYAFLLTRAVQFGPLSELVRQNYPDPGSWAVIMGLVQLGFDKIDPLHFSHRMTTNTFPDTPSHTVLLHVAMADAAVHNEASDLVGRNVGAKLLSPSPRAVWGLEQTSSPTTGNVYAAYDFNKPPAPAPNRPHTEEHDTHELLRRLRTGQDQVMHFLRSGETKSFCDGVCDPD